MEPLPAPPRRIVFLVIVLAQFCGTSLWFAGNGVVTTLQKTFQWPEGATGDLTAAVQVGFILGTIIITLTGLTDKVSPSKIFLLSCIAGALSNALPILDISSFQTAIGSRVMTGIALGGIYPVGMKIASDWKKHGLGNWLGSLVAALVMGTALPHALPGFSTLQNPSATLALISVIACIGGVVLFVFVGDGPYRKKSMRFSITDLHSLVRPGMLRSAMFGYFGHMWELYTFWALVPWIISRYYEMHQHEARPFLTFGVIAVGALGCWAGGKISTRVSSTTIARVALAVSGVCCLLSPWIWIVPEMVFIGFMIIWGIAVITDSPQFSAMIAAAADADIRGTAITFATSVGFTITVVSIQFVSHAAHLINEDYLLCLLAPGPILGLIFGRKPSA